MRRVLQVVKAMTRDGLETFIMNIYRCVDRNEIQFDFLVFTDEEAAYDSEILEMGGQIYHLPCRSLHYYKYVSSLKRFFDNHNYDVVHYHTNSLGNLEPLIIAALCGVRIRILHSHNSTVKGKKITRVLHRVNYALGVYHCANVLCACSEKAAIWFYGQNYKKKNVILIKNGIDSSLFSFSQTLRDINRKALGIADNTFVIGHVGRLTGIKNQRFIIDIVQELVNRGLSIKTLLLGEGEDRDNLQYVINQKGLQNHVTLVGSVPNTYDYYNAMDVFVMPSLFEGLPVTLVEAQCNGLPCIISDVISHDVDLVGIIKYLSLKDSVEVWADAICSVCELDRGKYYELIKEAGYDSNDTLKTVLSIYSRK